MLVARLESALSSTAAGLSAQDKLLLLPSSFASRGGGGGAFGATASAATSAAAARSELSSCSWAHIVSNPKSTG